MAGKNFIKIAEAAIEAIKDSYGCESYYKLDWIIDDSTVVCPDVMIVCGKFEEDYLKFPPVLILEIASEATRLKDRNIKFKLYETNGVKYYLIADPDRKSLEIFQLIHNRYQEVDISSFQISQTCTIDLDLQKIWA